MGCWSRTDYRVGCCNAIRYQEHIYNSSLVIDYSFPSYKPENQRDPERLVKRTIHADEQQFKRLSAFGVLLLVGLCHFDGSSTLGFREFIEYSAVCRI